MFPRDVFRLLFYVLFRSITFYFICLSKLSSCFKFKQTIVSSIERHNTDSISPTSPRPVLIFDETLSGRNRRDDFQIELIHEQLPLPVPCYDLVPVTELTLGPIYIETSGTPGSLDLTGGEYKT